MGSAAEKVWAAMFKEVQHMVQHSKAAEWTDADAPFHSSITGQISHWNRQPSPPHAAWKKLVAQIKVGWR